MKCFFFNIFLFFSLLSVAQQKQSDTLYLMNGQIIATSKLDTGLLSAKFTDPKDSTKKITLDNTDLFAIKFNPGNLFYYYTPDTIGNIFSREEMWLFMQGERDAKKGFKAKGSFYGGLVAGFAGGASGFGISTLGVFLAPVVPLAFLSMVGLPKVKIKHETVPNPENLKQDAYILGYEREARTQRRRSAMKGGGIGLAIGYIAYFSLKNILLK